MIGNARQLEKDRKNDVAVASTPDIPEIFGTLLYDLPIVPSELGECIDPAFLYTAEVRAKYDLS